MGKIALVLSGGGARGAYEAGVINYIRTGLPKTVSSRAFEIISGSSAGAINAAAVAAFAHDPELQGKIIREFWSNLKPEDVYNRSFSAAAQFISSSVGGLFRNLIALNPLRSKKSSSHHFNYILDTNPLREYLKKNIPWAQLNKNVLKGTVDALTVTATNTKSGRCELFIKKKPEINYTGEYRVHEVNFQAEHVIASAAIPVIFPTIKIGKTYYTDGGLRLFAPMSPAIQLNASGIIMVGLRHKATEQEIRAYDDVEMKTPPTIAQLAGRVMNMIFLDRVQYDLEQMDRINKVIEWSEKVYGKDYLTKINRMLSKERRTVDIAKRGLKKINVVEILPSTFISNIFEQWYTKLSKGVYKLSAMEQLLLRVLDVNATDSLELLSYLTFSKEYIQDLVELGYQDAKKQKDRLIDLLSTPHETD
ncbi:MAG: patatin-like phospholipase family protein [Deltaproteobacteria bacterium]|nr:patatin-like phospholipase family protein [Deltaproteobacteria bacterium]